MEQAEPRRFTATLSKKARRSRICIDYLRNGRRATAIAPYSTRASPGAPIACPGEWSDIGNLKPDQFDISPKRLPDPAEWAGFFERRQSITG